MHPLNETASMSQKTYYVELRLRWWFKWFFIPALSFIYGVTLNYIDMEAEIDQEWLQSWVSRATYTKVIKIQ